MNNYSNGKTKKNFLNFQFLTEKYFSIILITNSLSKINTTKKPAKP